MKKLIIAISFGLLTCPLYAAEDADSLRAKLEALQQQLAEQEMQAESLQSEYAQKHTTSMDLQGRVDQQAQLIELLKNTLNQGTQTTPASAPAPAPVTAALEDDDDDEILEIELTE